TLAFWFITGIYKEGRWRYYILAPAGCALAINCKFHVFPIVMVMIIAHCLRSGPGWKPALKALYSPKNLMALIVLLVCLAAAFPVLYLDYGFFRSHIFNYLTTMPGSYLVEGGQQFSFWKIRLNNIINFFCFSAMMEHGMGIYLTILGIAGLILSVIKRTRRLVLIAAFPLIYLVAAVLGASPSIRLQDTIPLYPYAALLTSIFIYWVLSRLLKKAWLLIPVFTICGLLILSPYLLAMLRMDYGYWLPDTCIYATQWAGRNIPPGSLVAREKKTLDLPAGRCALATKRRLCNSPVQAYKDQGFQYLVTSSRQANRMKDEYGLYGPDHPFGRFYNDIELEYNLLKSFDLGIIPYKGGVINIYELRQSFPLCPDGLNSSLLRCLGNDYSIKSPSIIFLDGAGRCEGNTGFQVPPESRGERLLISPGELPHIGVQVVNGSREGTIRIKAGGEKIAENFLPDQVRQFIFPARTEFPFIRYSYRIKVSSAWNSPCLVRILTDPYRIGLGFLRSGEPERAIEYLEKASRRAPGDWLIYHQLVEAYQTAGRPEEARGVISKMKSLFPDIGKLIAELHRSSGREKEWSEKFIKLAGYDPAWLQSRLAVSWGGNEMVEVSRAGKIGRRYYTRDFLLAPGGYDFTCELPAEIISSALDPIKITIRKDYQIVFVRKLSGEDFLDGVFRMFLESNRPGAVFSVEIEELIPFDPDTIKIEFVPELARWLKKEL
ncbi:MAG: tetratricopeptide repeat protein, partial [Candidatus Auribacterota bacterium]|nr:tetratricopeptide repeat protein [Candidatus Auribacterota bacterium]